MKDLPLRLAVAAIGIPILVFSILKGHIYFFMIIVLISVVGQWELYNLLKAKAMHAQRLPGILLGLGLLYLVAFGGNDMLIIILLLVATFLFGSEMFRNKGSANLNIAATLMGVVYPTAFLSGLLFLRFNIHEILPKTE
jgi:phosphatidate cytidylyltransferase